MANPTAVPTLLDSACQRGGEPQFRATLGEFVRDLYLGRIDSAHIVREAMAQILRLQQAGVAVTHVDTHKHTHMFPRVLKSICERRRPVTSAPYAIPLNPLGAWPQPPALVSFACGKCDSCVPSVTVLEVDPRARFFFTTEGCVGVAATGTLNEATLRTLLNRLPEGIFGLDCHPAYMDDELMATRTRLQQSRQVELAALQTIPSILDSVRFPVQLIDFGHLSAHGTTLEP